MKKLKKQILTILLVLNILMMNVLSIKSFALTNEVNNKDYITKNEFIKKVELDDSFKEFKNVLVSKNARILNELTDDKNNTVGYIAQYEIYIEKKEKINIPLYSKEKPFIEIKTKTTSTITFLYNFSEGIIEAFLTDYSNLENEKISLTDLKRCKTETFSITKKDSLYKHSLKLKELKNNILNDATQQLRDYRSKCAWWTCTEYSTVGGYIHESCEKYLGWACDGLSASGKLKIFGWAVCKAGSLIACYVPKTKHCVSGYWETKFCPAGPEM